MVALPKSINAIQEVIKPSNKVNIPDGHYHAVIVDSGMEKSPYGFDKPDGVFIKTVITQGQYAHTEFKTHLAIFDEASLNPNNPEWTASKSAYGVISQILLALGIPEVPEGFETSGLHNKPIIISTKTKKGKDKETGNHKPEWDESSIHEFLSVSSVGVTQGHPTFASATAPAKASPFAAQPQPRPTAPVAPSSAPWAS